MDQAEKQFDKALLEPENKDRMANRIRAREAADRIQVARLRRGFSLRDVAKAMAALLGQEVTHQQTRFWEIQFSQKMEDQFLEGLSTVLNVPATWISHGTGELPEVSNVAMASIFRNLPRQTRIDLALRAKARREEVGASIVEVAQFMGINFASLVQKERSIPLKRTKEEAAWEKAIYVPEGWLRDLDMPTPPYTDFMELSELDCSTVAEEIRMLSCWLARKSLFKRTFSYENLDEGERRASHILAQRYGVLGQERSTLQAIGNDFGITRERIRQIVADLVERAGDIAVKTPMFDLLASRIAELVPLKLSELDQALKSLLGEELSVLGADQFAREVLGKPIATLTQHASNMGMASDWVAIDSEDHDPEAARAVRECARNMIRSCGAAHLSFVCGEASDMLKRGLTMELTIQACKILPGFEWLSERDGWFWLGIGPENRLVNNVYKVMAVANRNVESEELHAALMRSRRERYSQDKSRPYAIELPLTICTEVIKRLPGLKSVQHDDFYVEEPLDRKALLSETENALFGLMKRHGGVIARHTMHAELIDKDIVKFMALQMCLDATPIINRIDYGLYTLRGYSLEPEMLRLQAQAVGGPFRTSAAPAKNSDGTYIYVFEMTEYMEKTRNFALPAALARMLSPGGDFVLEGFPEPCSVVDYGNRRVRLMRFCSKLVKLGYRAGDMLCMTIYPEERRLFIRPATAIDSHVNND